MLEGPDPYKQPEKLVLPAPPTEAYHAAPPDYLAHTEQRPFRGGRLIHTHPAAVTPPVGSLHGRLANLWQRDPAYKVLFIAIAVVLLSSGVCIALLAGFIAQLSSSPLPVTTIGQQATPTSAIQPTVQATAAPTAEPTPMPTATPVVMVTPAPIATAPAIIAPTPDPNGRLTVQIGPLPTQVNNNSMLPVTVSTNQPGASISLFVTYSAIPFLYTSAPQTADASGNTTFSWSIHERTFSPFTRMVAANITAVARYQDRPQATSQTVTVHILTK